MFNMATWAAAGPARQRGLSCTARCRGRCRRPVGGFDTDEVPIARSPTGVHGHTWAAREVAPLLGEPGWKGASAAEALRNVSSIQPGPVAAARPTCGCGWSQEVRRRVRAAWLERCVRPGAGLDRLGVRPDVLTIGFARRVADVQAAHPDAARPGPVARPAARPGAPVQLVVAGKSHPADDGGKALIQQIVPTPTTRRCATGSCSCPTTTCRWPGTCTGLRRVAEQPLAPAGGVRARPA